MFFHSKRNWWSCWTGFSLDFPKCRSIMHSCKVINTFLQSENSLFSLPYPLYLLWCQGRRLCCMFHPFFCQSRQGGTLLFSVKAISFSSVSLLKSGMSWNGTWPWFSIASAPWLAQQTAPQVPCQLHFVVVQLQHYDRQGEQLLHCHAFSPLSQSVQLGCSPSLWLPLFKKKSCRVHREERTFSQCSAKWLQVWAFWLVMLHAWGMCLSAQWLLFWFYYYCFSKTLLFCYSSKWWAGVLSVVSSNVLFDKQIVGHQLLSAVMLKCCCLLWAVLQETLYPYKYRKLQMHLLMKLQKAPGLPSMLLCLSAYNHKCKRTEFSCFCDSFPYCLGIETAYFIQIQV